METKQDAINIVRNSDIDEFTRLLDENPGYVNQVFEDSTRPASLLLLALVYQKLDKARILLDRGAIPREQPRPVVEAFFASIKNGKADIELLRRILAKGVDAPSKQKECFNFIRKGLFKVFMFDLIEVLTALSEAGFDLKTIEQTAEASLVAQSVEHGQQDEGVRNETAEYLLELGCSAVPLGKDYPGYSSRILVEAMENQMFSLAEILLERGAAEGDGRVDVLFHVAARYRDIPDALRDRFMTADENFDICDLNGESLLTVAMYSENVEFMSRAFELGADIDFRDMNGNSTLINAIRNKQKDMAEFLIERGANTRQTGANGETAYDVASVTAGMKSLYPKLQ